MSAGVAVGDPAPGPDRMADGGRGANGARWADPVAGAAQRLRAAGVSSPRVDAELLAASVLGVPRGALPLARWDDAALARFAELVRRRAAREPVQYLTGRAGFRRLDLAVGPGVFVPRPETECLVDWCVPRLRPGATVVDLCAGSGAIGLALADEVAGIEVHAVEREPGAFAWLARNGAGRGAHLHLGGLDSAPPGLDGRVDLVASNPPYLPAELAAEVEPEVARFEPGAALWVEGDGLAVVRAVVARAARLLRPGGLLAVEHSDEQGPAALELLSGPGWADAADHPDLVGRPRFVTARRVEER